MFAQYYTPSANLHNKDLDLFLSKGWFRSGQSINTSTILNFKNKLYSPVRVRLPLKDYQFKKRLKKILNKNSCFETVYRPAILDDEKETLYKHFKNRYKDEVPKTLKQYLLDGKEDSIYNTYEVAVYNNDELIAASFFDLGKKCIASILGIYNPKYEKNSPGIFTMLAEIQFGIANNFDFYFPGYVVPGYGKFDYKLRIGGNLEYYEPLKDVWFPYEEMKESDLPSNIIEDKLIGISVLLKEAGIEHQLYYYPFINKGFKIQNNDVIELDSPLFIHLLTETNNLALSYQYETGCFELSRYLGFEFSIIDYPVYFSHNDYPTFSNTLLKTNVVVKSKDPTIVTKKIKTIHKVKV